MASPQLENGFTRIANEIMEHLSYPGINGSEYRVAILVLRKTYGFGKPKDKISLTQFQKGTLMERKHAVETIKSLVGKRILVKEGNSYRFNKNWEEWVVGKRTPGVQKPTGSSVQKPPKTSVQKPTHKRKKESIKEIGEASSPEIPLLIKSFEALNPASKKFYGNKTQREACSNLIQTYSFDRVKGIVELTLPKTNNMEFFPTITTPLQLWEKWAQLEAAVRKYKSKIISTPKAIFS